MPDEFLQAAIEEAQQGLREGGIPIGSVIVHRGKIIGRGHNRRVQQGSAVLHGEMDALENAGRQPASVYRESRHLHDALALLDVQRRDPPLRHPARRHRRERDVHGRRDLLRSRGCNSKSCRTRRAFEMMREFIEAHPKLWNEDIGA